MSLLRPLLFLSVLAVGCSSHANTGASSGGSGGTAGRCNDDAAAGVCVTDVTGKLVDASGAAVANAPVSVCGDVCYSGQADASGQFDVPIGDNGAHITLSKYFFLIHARPLRASFYYPLTGSPKDGVIDIGTRLVLTLPANGPTLQVRGSGAPAQTVTSGDVTLIVPDGVDVQPNVEDIAAGAAGLEFRALTVPANERDNFIDPSLGALALYAVGPFEAEFDQKGTTASAEASLSFNNTTGLAAGTPIQLLAMGRYSIPPGAVAPGSFAPVATGKVSGDGKTIALDPGQGLEYLTWVAIRKKQ